MELGELSEPPLHLALGDASCLATTDNEVMLYRYWKGGHNCERNRRIPRISPPVFCTEAKVAKGGGGHICRTLRYYHFISLNMTWHSVTEPLLNLVSQSQTLPLDRVWLRETRLNNEGVHVCGQGSRLCCLSVGPFKQSKLTLTLTLIRGSCKGSCSDYNWNS